MYKPAGNASQVVVSNKSTSPWRRRMGSGSANGIWDVDGGACDPEPECHVALAILSPAFRRLKTKSPAGGKDRQRHNALGV
jgi:hypothetical protein